MVLEIISAKALVKHESVEQCWRRSNLRKLKESKKFFRVQKRKDRKKGKESDGLEFKGCQKLLFPAFSFVFHDFSATKRRTKFITYKYKPKNPD